VLTGRTAVVIDDDIRNIFSLASALEEYGIELRYAESGRAGLELLDSLPSGRHGAGRHHDARHGRLRDHARDPLPTRGSPIFRSSPSRPRR
jgi:CheY-like chemotaxis protein